MTAAARAGKTGACGGVEGRIFLIERRFVECEVEILLNPRGKVPGREQMRLGVLIVLRQQAAKASAWLSLGSRAIRLAWLAVIFSCWNASATWGTSWRRARRA